MSSTDAGANVAGVLIGLLAGRGRTRPPGSPKEDGHKRPSSRGGRGPSVPGAPKVGPGGGELGPIRVPQPVGPYSGGSRTGPVGPEYLPQPGFGHRAAAGRAPQHDKALRRAATRRALRAQV